MADLNDVNSAQSIKIIGSDSTGIEQTPVQSTSNGGLHSNLRDNTGTEIGISSNPLKIAGNVAAAATDSGDPVKVGGKYTTTTPLLTSGQRGDIQLDENSNLIAVDSSSAYTAQQKVFSTTTTTALTVGTSEVAAFLFKNPNASGKKCRIFKILLNLTGALTYRFYHTPTITSNGTSLTSINQRIMTSPATAVATPFQSPTISANGTLLLQYSCTAQAGTKELLLDHNLTLDPNFNFLITGQAGSNNTPITITLFWYEVN